MGRQGGLQRGSRRGMALLSSVFLLALLVAMYLRASGEAALQARLDGRLEQAFNARMAARSGISAALALLFRDTNAFDWPEEDWAVYSSSTRRFPLMVGSAACVFTITDESSKMHVNSVDEETLTGLFDRFDLGITGPSGILGEAVRQGSARRLAQRIMDYVDADQTARAMGSEIEGYERMPGRRPRNGPMEDLRELLNIPGVTEELVQASGTRPGLFDLLTVYGEGRVNLNTARRELVESLPGPLGFEGAQRTTFFQRLFETLPMTRAGAFKDFLAIHRVALDPEFVGRLVLSSDCFRVESTGTYQGVEVRMIAVVNRDRAGGSIVRRITEIP